MSATSTWTNSSPSTSPPRHAQPNTAYFPVDPPPSTPSAVDATAKPLPPRRPWLMPDATHQDPSHPEKQRAARRRLQSFVFDDVPLDWKSTPVLCEDHPFAHHELERRHDLRCHASRSYLAQVRHDLRHLRTPTPVPTTDPGPRIVAAEEFFDMIG